jgi:hypothetical protein
MVAIVPVGRPTLSVVTFVTSVEPVLVVPVVGGVFVIYVLFALVRCLDRRLTVVCTVRGWCGSSWLRIILVGVLRRGVRLCVEVGVCKCVRVVTWVCRVFIIFVCKHWRLVLWLLHGGLADRQEDNCWILKHLDR